MSVCLYPGTFDPFTNGHLDILTRGCRLFDSVIVSILINTSKKPVFSLEERVDFIKRAGASAGVSNFSVRSFDGLTVEFARECGANAILRGVRTVSDHEYEMQIAAINKRLAPEIETVFMMTETEYSFVSSSIVKEIAYYGGDISALVPKEYSQTIIERLSRKWEK